MPEQGATKAAQRFQSVISVLFRATAIAWVVARYPQHRVEFRAAAAAAAAAATRIFALTDDHAVNLAARAADLASRVIFADNFPAMAADVVDMANDAATIASDADMWGEAHDDVNCIIRLGVDQFSNARLWWTGAPLWCVNYNANLFDTLPTTDNWDVWTDWLRERAQGVSRTEAHELVFATVPLEV
jgi:hypothetical protein